MSDYDFRRYREDPLAFVDEVLGVTLYSKQREIVEAVRDHDRNAVKSGNATGKSTAAATAMLAWLAGGPGSVVISTSATEGQLRRVLWRETRQRFKAARGYFAGANVTETEIFIEPGWYATGFSTDTPEAIQGVHAERVLVVVDEASGVSEDIFDAIEGLLAGGETRLLLIGNPLKTSGSFYDAFNSRRDEFHTITVDAYSTPNFTGEDVPRELRKRLVSRRWVERLEKQQAGTNTFLVKVLGEFPAQADDTVIARADLERAHAAHVEPGLPLVLGADIARYGDDENVLALREGNVVRIIDAWQGKSLMETTGRIVDHAKRIQTERARRPRIVVDDAGLGGGVTDRLRELGLDVVAFNGGGRARHPDDYPNRRSELWFECAEVLPALDLDPGDEELARELLAPTFSFDSTGARVVEQKSNTRKRLRRSPDRADAVLLTLAVDPPRAPGRLRRTFPTISWARETIPTGEPVVHRDRPLPAVFDLGARAPIPGATVTKAAPVDLSRGGFVWGEAPEQPTAVAHESRGALVSKVMRGIPLRPQKRGEKRTLRRGLFVPLDIGAPLTQIADSTGIAAYDGGRAATDLLAGRRSAADTAPGDLSWLAPHDAQAELGGYLGGGE